jgi:hypothetical protein
MNVVVPKTFEDIRVNYTSGLELPVGYGLLEMSYDGDWGTVCGERFDMDDALVACRHLGFSYVEGYGTTGQNLGADIPIWLDELACAGNETVLWHCGHYSKSGRNQTCPLAQGCTHYEDIAIKCSATPPPTGRMFSELRLNTTSTLLPPGYGVVEVKYDDTWGLVCGDNFDVEDAQVICHQLGFQHVGGYGMMGSAYTSSLPIWLDEVKCIGNESALWNCS